MSVRRDCAPAAFVMVRTFIRRVKPREAFLALGGPWLTYSNAEEPRVFSGACDVFTGSTSIRSRHCTVCPGLKV